MRPVRPRWRIYLLRAGSVLLCLLALLWLLRSLERPGQTVRETVHYPEGETARQRGDFESAIAAYRRSIEIAPRDPRPYYGLVESHFRQGNLDAVEPILRSMLTADPRNACVHYGLGCLAVRRQDLETARAEARSAMELDPGLGQASLLMGSVHYYAGRPREAVTAWRQARRVFRRAHDLEYEAWALNRIAVVQRELGRFREALAGFDEALAIQTARGDRKAQQLILGNLGLTRSDLGDLTGAMLAFRRTLALARETGDAEGECWNLTNLAHAWNQVGEPRRAIECADSAIALARVVANPADQVSGLLCRASACFNLGDPLAALSASKEAVALAEPLVDARERTGALLSLARAHLLLGQIFRARELFTLADSLFREIGAEAGSWEASIGLCEVLCQEGDTTRAIVLGEKALKEMAKAEYAEGEEALAAALAAWVEARGEHAQALDLSSRAVEISRKNGRRNREALALARRSGILLALGRDRDARLDARSARTIARELRNPEVLWPCEMAEADAWRASDPRRAALHFGAMLDALEAVERNLRLEEFRAASLEKRFGLYYKAADLYVQMGRPEQAFVTCERARARSFRDLLAMSPAPVPLRIPPSLAARHRALEEKIHTLQATRAQLAARPDGLPRRFRTVDRDLGRANEEWEEVRAEVLLQDPRYAMLAPGAQKPDFRRIARTIGREDALIEYALGPQSSLCFVVRDGQVWARRLEADAGFLSGEIDSLLAAFESPLSLGTLEFDLDLAARLRRQILDPILPLVDGARKLFIVPDGPLHRLPFELLAFAPGAQRPDGVLYGEFRNAQFLDGRFAIEYLPAAALLGSPPRAREMPPGDLLAMGDPQAEESPRGNPAVPPASPGLVRTGAAPPSRLPHAADEVQAIMLHFPGAVAWTGREATEERFKSLAPDYRYLHLSAHGSLDEAVPLYSGLSLAAKPGGSEDGFLHAYEVLALPLRCDLVTLSGCQTGRGRVYAGEGLLGLTRCFLHAGAGRALVSLWAVNDASTAILMDRFYANLAAGRDAAEALSEARSTLRGMVFRDASGKSVSYAHPFFWAPFVLISAGAPAENLLSAGP
jgi:CHAT domain-containing protein/Tfp pilus assembly protein PilF